MPSLYGVSGRLGIITRPLSYEKPLGAVYRELLVSLLEWNPELLSVIMGMGEPRLSDVPSWVPDWSTLAHQKWVPKDRSNNSRRPKAQVHILSAAELAVSARAVDRLTFCSMSFDRAVIHGTAGRHAEDSQLQCSLASLGAWMDIVAVDAPAAAAC